MNYEDLHWVIFVIDMFKKKIVILDLGSAIVPIVVKHTAV